MCIAYIDPGNLEADLQTGAYVGYSLLWLLLLATAMGFLLQSLAAKLGVTTGRHLAQHCRERYPRPIRIILWLMAEFAIIGSDIQEVIGTAIAASILTRGALPLWMGVIFAAVAAYLFLLLEKFGVRWLEAFFQVLVGIMAVTMGLLFFLADVPYIEVAKGFIIPKLSASGLPTAAALVGSILMPHNLFLHSALVHNRALPAQHRASPLRETLRYYNLEAAIALCITLAINTSVISVFAKGFNGKDKPEDIGLENAGYYLGTRFGRHMELIWAVGLLAAGQSSTMTGTYAGQFVMSGYLDLRIKPYARALVTRAVAVGPTLLVALSARKDSTKLDAFNQWLNILQAVQLPFAVFPLLALTSDVEVMSHRFVNSKKTAIAAWTIALGIMVVNCGTAYQLLQHRLSDNPALHAMFICGVIVYVGFVGYLLFEIWDRKRAQQQGVAQMGADSDDDGGSVVTPLLMRRIPSTSGGVSIPRDRSSPGLSSHAIDDAEASP